MATKTVRVKKIAVKSGTTASPKATSPKKSEASAGGEQSKEAKIEGLLKQLATETDKMEKRRLRRNLRSLGHTGGLKGTKYAKAK